MNPTSLGSSTPEPPLAFSCHTSVDTTQFEAFDVIHLPKTKAVTHKKLRKLRHGVFHLFLVIVCVANFIDRWVPPLQTIHFLSVPSEMLIH